MSTRPLPAESMATESTRPSPVVSTSTPPALGTTASSRPSCVVSTATESSTPSPVVSTGTPLSLTAARANLGEFAGVLVLLLERDSLRASTSEVPSRSNGSPGCRRRRFAGEAGADTARRPGPRGESARRVGSANGTSSSWREKGASSRIEGSRNGGDATERCGDPVGEGAVWRVDVCGPPVPPAVCSEGRGLVDGARLRGSTTAGSFSGTGASSRGSSSRARHLCAARSRTAASATEAPSMTSGRRRERGSASIASRWPAGRQYVSTVYPGRVRCERNLKRTAPCSGLGAPESQNLYRSSVASGSARYNG